MPEIVRVATNEEGVELSWPARCPRCGAAPRRLVPSVSRVGQVKSLRPNLMGGWTMRSNVMYVSVPMCEVHAGSNSLANKILERSPLMAGLRGVAWMGLAMLLSLLASIFTRRGVSHLMELDAFLLFPLFGIVGGLTVWWARQNTSVRPARFDPDMDVVEIEFADTRYAHAFKRANRDVTDSLLTAAPPWYMRSLLWKVVLVFVLVAWLMHLGRH